MNRGMKTRLLTAAMLVLMFLVPIANAQSAIVEIPDAPEDVQLSEYGSVEISFTVQIAGCADYDMYIVRVTDPDLVVNNYTRIFGLGHDSYTDTFGLVLDKEGFWQFRVLLYKLFNDTDYDLYRPQTVIDIHVSWYQPDNTPLQTGFVLLVVAVAGIGGVYAVYSFKKKKPKSTDAIRQTVNTEVKERPVPQTQPMVLVICPYCGMKVEQGITTCPHCGAKL